MNNDKYLKSPQPPLLKRARIGIDARFYGPIGKGLGRYTQETVDNIIKQDQENNYVVFLGRENFKKFQIDNPRVKKVLADIRWYGITEQLVMPLLIWREKLDLMHFPHFNVPVLCPVKFVVTIHDLILLKFPTRRASTLGPVLYAIKSFFYKIVITAAVKRAVFVLTVSSYTKNDLISRFKIRPEKVVVTYQGVSDFNRGLKNTSRPEAILKKYGLAKPYLLYVGNAYPHKNLDNLIRVSARIKEQRQNLKLVLVGKEDYFYHRLKEYAKKFPDSVIFPGYVPDRDLGILYGEALAYVFPSLFEGFGLPPLEAMSYGLPVASSNKTSLPEILGTAALYFNPENESEMKEKIELIISDEKLRQDLRARGYEQIKKYSWNECAEKTRQVYRNCFKIVITYAFFKK